MRTNEAKNVLDFIMICNTCVFTCYVDWVYFLNSFKSVCFM